MRDGGNGGCLLRTGDVKTAFALLVVFPPPSSGALRLAGLDGARTRLAADGGISTLVQRIDGDVFLGDMRPDEVDIPVSQGIDLDEIAIRIKFGERRRGAIAGLAATKAGDPEGGAVQRLAKRDQLSDMTAGVTGFNTLVKTVEPIFSGIGVDIVLLGPEAADFNAETLLGFIDEIDGFPEQAAVSSVTTSIGRR